MGEWNFVTTYTAPPSTGQVRINNATQTAATLLWVHEVTANGLDAIPVLSQLVPGHVLDMHDKDDPLKWQHYVVTAPPIDKGTYWEIPVAWLKGGNAVTQQRIMFSCVGIRVAVTGRQMAVSRGSLTVDLSKSVTVYLQGAAMIARTPATIESTGETIHHEYAFPFSNAAGISPGMTLRQWYAGQAAMGFISANPAANLVGKLSQLAFRVADSMIAFERREAAGFIEPPVPTAQPPRGSQTPPLRQSIAPGKAQITVLQKRSVRG
jgi:hypothetical protein